MTDAVLDRIVEKLNDLDARVRALERGADSERALEDIRTTLAMMAEANKGQGKGRNNGTGKADVGEGGEGEAEEKRYPVQDPRMWAM